MIVFQFVSSGKITLSSSIHHNITSWVTLSFHPVDICHFTVRGLGGMLAVNNAEAQFHIGDYNHMKYLDLKNIGLPALDEDTGPKCRILLDHEVPLLLLRPGFTRETTMRSTQIWKTSRLQKTPDEEVAYLMSQPLSVLACEIPLPPSPPPAEAWLRTGVDNEKKYLHLWNIWFPPLEDDTDPKYPIWLPHEVLLLPSPPPPEAGLHMGEAEVKKYPVLTNFGFPLMNIEMADLMPLT